MKLKVEAEDWLKEMIRELESMFKKAQFQKQGQSSIYNIEIIKYGM